MFYKYLSKFLYGTCAVLALTSCGDSKASGTGEFATVFATASPPATVLRSDVARWSDPVTGAASVVGCVGDFTVTADDVNYSITSKAYNSSNTGQANPTTPSDLSVKMITLTFNPIGNAPILPPNLQTQFPSPGQNISPTGSPQSVPVTVASEDLKRYLRNADALGNRAISCNSNPIYAYWVVASFLTVEGSTNQERTIIAPGFRVEFTDYEDK